VTGSSCTITASGGATSTIKTTVASGGTATGGSKTTASGGTVAKGGTTAAWTDPNPTVCDDVSTTTNTFKAQYVKMHVPLTNNPTKSYVALSNWWSVFNAQTVALNGLGYTLSNPNGASSSNGSDPIGYPCFFIGSYQGTTSLVSGLPKLVSSISSVPIVFDTNLTSINNSDLNASLDVWFNTSSANLGTSVNKPTGGYLMVWLHKPTNKQPRGSVVSSGQTISGASGTWDVWSDGVCVSYVRTSATSSLTFDLNSFIKHSVSTNGVIKNNWYLAVIFGGFEVWSGGSGAKINKFCAKVN
jgi:hypothetical protein